LRFPRGFVSAANSIAVSLQTDRPLESVLATMEAAIAVGSRAVAVRGPVNAAASFRDMRIAALVLAILITVALGPQATRFNADALRTSRHMFLSDLQQLLAAVRYGLILAARRFTRELVANSLAG